MNSESKKRKRSSKSFAKPVTTKTSKTQKKIHRDSKIRNKKALKITSNWSDEDDAPLSDTPPANTKLKMEEYVVDSTEIQDEDEVLSDQDLDFADDDSEDDESEVRNQESTLTKTTPKSSLPAQKKNEKGFVGKNGVKIELSDEDWDEDDDMDSDDDNFDDTDDDNDDDDKKSDNDLDNDNLKNQQINDSSKHSKMANAISRLLGQELGKAEISRPILANRKSIERNIDDQKIDEKARKILSKQKKKKESDGRVMPDLTKMDYEKKLRKLATKGVVQLFNAIRIAQKASVPIDDKIMAPTAKAEQGRLSKNVFLNALKVGEKANETTGNPKKNADKNTAPVSWLKSDYMTKPAESHWDEKDDDF
ncbi:hypothetical protein HK096_011530 [Nowakowskiella sp. JEL0078]|nr:hypothetical protein HK096_011530 [Nowakowskiella sp. JEL0078]